MPREKIKKINRKIKAPRNFGSKAKKITKIWQQKYFPLSKSKLKSRNLRAALVGQRMGKSVREGFEGRTLPPTHQDGALGTPSQSVTGFPGLLFLRVMGRCSRAGLNLELKRRGDPEARTAKGKPWTLSRRVGEAAIRRGPSFV